MRREPKRLDQLRVLANLENELRIVIAALHRHEITWDRAALRTSLLFEDAEATLGDDLAVIFCEADRLPAMAESRQ